MNTKLNITFRSGFKAAEYILTAGLIFTVFACGLCNLTTVIRVVYSVAEDGLVFSFLSIVNKRTQVPMWNVLVCGTLGIGTSIVYDFDTLSHMVSENCVLDCYNAPVPPKDSDRFRLTLLCSVFILKYTMF